MPARVPVCLSCLRNRDRRCIGDHRSFPLYQRHSLEPSGEDELRAQAPALPAPSLPRAAAQAGFLERWDLGELGGGISQPAQEQEHLAASEGLPAPRRTPLERVPRRRGSQRRSLFLLIFFSGLAVAGFSSACLQDKKAHGATCPRREGSSPPWTPPLVFLHAREGTLYVQFVGSTPLCHPGLPNDFVLTCTRGI